MQMTKTTPRLTLIAASAALLAGCTAPEPAPEPTDTAWTFEANADALRAASCPDTVSFTRPEAITLNASPVTLSEIDPETDLPGVSFAGGWDLTSPEPRFGGLSGLEAFASGNLLSVTDQGAMVWINLEDGIPATANILSMLTAEGAPITGKSNEDAEGLYLQDGLALVSLERNHRILAYDLEGCGAAALGAELATIPNRPAGMARDLENNGGPEGLALLPSGELLLAIETEDDGLPLGRLDANGTANIDQRVASRDGPVFTGIDVFEDTLYAVLRHYQPDFGTTIELIAMPVTEDGVETEPRLLARLLPKHGTDNFEGIVLDRLDDGTLRLWLIADNNFAGNQRNLLYAFDVTSS